MDTVLLRLARAMSALIDLIGRAASWLVLALVLLIAGEVLMRYGFDKSSIAAQEMEWWGLAIISLLGVSFTLKEGEHVRVDVLYKHVPPRFAAALDWLALVALGGGSLVTSIYSNEQAFLERAALGSAPWSGRVWLASDKMAEQSLAPGMVLPQMIHGGPGRAGGGGPPGGGAPHRGGLPGRLRRGHGGRPRDGSTRPTRRGAGCATRRGSRRSRAR